MASTGTATRSTAAGQPKNVATPSSMPSHLPREGARACGLREKYGWGKAHNMVRMASEPMLYGAQPQLGDRLSAACADEALHARLAALLAGHFGLSADALAPPMQRFTS